MPSIKDYGVGGQLTGGNIGIFTPTGVTQTTAEKQVQNPYYNPLYDPRTTEYYQNLVNSSNPSPIAQPLAPQGVVPSVTPKTSNASISGTPHVGSIPPQMIGQSPNLSPPVSVPQGNAQPKIELPDVFKVNSQIAGQNLMPPLSIRNGITMPAVTPGVKPQSFPSMNWSDLLTVAHTR